MDELNISVQDVTESNFRLVQQLNNQIFPIKYNNQFYNDVMKNPQYSKIALCNRKPAGVICCRVDGESIYLMSIGVLSQFREKKIASKLLQSVLDECSSSFGKFHPKSIYLHIQATNAAGLKLYEKFGFNQEEEIAGYYKYAQGNEQTALLLRKVL